ncbi:DUF6418 domain-containing protein [Acinetobacter gyllenbergii]|uniref:DUF6418 domain-containing protein n=1 Tax=Acinetobacter gyllenbergii TaxID=134534 RepID=UPI003AF79133
MKIISFLIFLILLLIPMFFVGWSELLIYFDYYSVFIFLFFVYYLAVKDKNFFIISFYVFFAFVTTIVISLLVEHGTYLLEVDEMSYATGITFKGALTGFLFISSMYFSFKLFQKTNISVRNLNRPSQILIFNLFRLLVASISIVMLLLLLRYGFPLFMGVHRADYWASYAPSWGGVLAFWLVQLAFPLGYMYAKSRSKKDLYLFLGLLIVTILAGSRFTGIMQSLVYFLIPVLVISSKFKIYNPKFSVSFGVVFVLLLSIVLNSFDASSKQERQANLGLRIALQAQMWWALDNISTLSPRSTNEIINSYIGVAKNPNDKSVNYLMYLVAPAKSVLSKTETDSTYTMSGFFNSYYFFGYILGGIVNIFWGVFFGFLIFLVYLSIVSSSNILMSFFAFKLLVKVQNILLNGNVDNIFDLSTYFFIVLIFMFLALSTRGKREIGNE